MIPIPVLIIGLLLIELLLLSYVYSTKIKKTKEETRKDTVTGGMNEAAFRMEAEKLRRQKKIPYTMVSMDMRNYARISKTFGGENGKRTLAYLYTVLKGNLSGEEPVGRGTGDEFFFLLKNQSEDEIRARIKRIYDAANRFNQTRKDTYYLQLCFGVYIPDGPDEDLMEMQCKASEARKLSNADVRYQFYEKDKREKNAIERNLVAQVETSLRQKDFVVYLQPKVRLSDSRVVGAEALMRWKHPEQGMLSPAMFVPLLEEYRMIYRLDIYLFEEV